LRKPVEQGQAVTEALDEQRQGLPEIRAFMQHVFPALAVEEVKDLLLEFSEAQTLPDYDWREVLDELEELREDTESYTALTEQYRRTWRELPSARPSVGQRQALVGFQWPEEEIGRLNRFEASWCIDAHLRVMRAWTEQKAKVWSIVMGTPAEEILDNHFGKPWQLKPATPKQIALLKRLKVPLPPGDLTAGDASIIIDRVLAEKKAG